ncbi:hypothetical protein GCM10023172_41230 [Hymenobacter ginsengisoli]|uniref:DUF5666 domain-containing protein n=1 Tax=Hymenobacter ginsengisoli TaxID=1051626 RepID=A0ABP8QQG1_9BACT|nr:MULTISPECIES: hypothetical protein [unclassified Hymenobacter]MBO2032233.1 hypothetical protein [Hymenobacter sp. BT559]
MQKSLSGLALLTAALLTSPTAHAQQTVVKTKTKMSKNAKSTAAAPVLPPAPGMAPPADGPAGPPPPPSGGTHGERGPGPMGGPGGHRGPRGGQVQVLSDVRGTLASYQARNDEQVYDAFVLRPEGSAASDTIHFPRHLGQQLTAAVKAGSTVTVTGFRQTGPDGRSRFHFVSLTSGSQTVRDTRPTPPSTLPTEQAATVKGTIRELRRGPRGEIRSLLLSDQSIVQLPPRAVEQLADKLTPGASLEASGTLRTAHPGEALASTTPVHIVRAETLTLGGNKYLIR